ncbi:hypothetical protein [Chroococcidiopsis sp. SAG 2025]|uniref:hypothetical protein n=1 Tax=Chroococcidiopsis sp. SAG 2025 TaxID=171389 RepID=UPI0029371ED3|nr:hypothetical protein [Chroococcidiopsis sp. SAG 2025]
MVDSYSVVSDRGVGSRESGVVVEIQMTNDQLPMTNYQLPIRGIRHYGDVKWRLE